MSKYDVNYLPLLIHPSINKDIKLKRKNKCQSMLKKFLKYTTNYQECSSNYPRIKTL